MRRHAWMWLVLAASAAPALGQATTEPARNETSPAAPGAPPPSYGLTGDWWGRRPQLEAAGVTFAGMVQLDITKVARGGIDTEAFYPRYLLDLSATLDLEKLVHLRGATMLVDSQSHQGRVGSEAVGEAQGFDVMDAPNFVQFAQVIYEQKLGDHFRVRLGKIDANYDFCVIDHGKEFIQSALTYTPTMFSLPTYPDPAPGGELFFQPADVFYAGAGAFYANQDQRFLVLSGRPEDVERVQSGTFLIGELGSRWKLPRTELAGHAAIGGWAHTDTYQRADGNGTSTGSGGVYGLLDQTLWQGKDAGGHTREVGVFVIGGWSDPVTNLVSGQLGAGIAGTGLIPGRVQDVMGLGATWGQLGHAAQPRAYSSEFAVDGFYKLDLGRGVSLKPDLQYIVHPSGLHPDAVVMTLRLEVDF